MPSAKVAARPTLERLGNLQLKCSREIGEELVGEFLGRAVDEPLSQLRKLSTDLRLDLIGQQRAIIPLKQSNLCATFREACDTALPSPTIL